MSASGLSAVALSVALSGCSLNLFAPEPTPTAIPTPTAVPSGLSVTWAAGGKIFVWHDGSPVRQVADTDADAPQFAPNGQSVAFVRNPVGGPQSLWVARLADGRLEQYGDPLPINGGGRTEFSQFSWADSQSLFFATQLSFTQSSRRQYDLHNVDLATGMVGQVLRAGLGGVMTFSPDRLHVVLMDPGAPGGSVDGSIALFDPVALGGNIKITFPAAGKGGLQPFDVPIDWQSDSSAFYAATVTWDKVLLPGRDNLRMTVWRTPVGDFSRTAGVVLADIYGMPRVSPDGTRIVYLRRPLAANNPQTLELVVADLGDSFSTVYASGPSDSFGAPYWLTSEIFIYRTGSKLMLGKLRADPQELPDANPAGTPVLAGKWLVYPGQRVLLLVAPLDAPDQNFSIGSAVSDQPPPRFDAVIAPAP